MSTTDLARKALLAVIAIVVLAAAGRSFYITGTCANRS